MQKETLIYRDSSLPPTEKETGVPSPKDLDFRHSDKKWIFSRPGEGDLGYIENKIIWMYPGNYQHGLRNHVRFIANTLGIEVV